MLVGKNCLGQSGSIAAELAQGRKAFIVADETTMKVAGDQVENSLKDDGFDISTHLTRVASEESVADAQKALGGADVVFGIGGGTCIDVAKLVSANEKLPFISVPTSASHDGMCSPVASIRVDKYPKSFPAAPPIAIIADTNVIATAPPKFMAAGCGDLVANYTSVEDWRIANREKGEEYMEYSAALAIMSAGVILKSVNEIAKKTDDGVKTVVEGLICSGAAMCVAGSSRPCSGAEHLFSHALDRISPVHALHGEQCGVGAIMMAKLQGLDWEEMKGVLKKIGAPTTAEGLGIGEEYIIKALTMAHTLRDRYTILGEKGLTEEKAKELAKETGVI